MSLARKIKSLSKKQKIILGGTFILTVGVGVYSFVNKPTAFEYGYKICKDIATRYICYRE